MITLRKIIYDIRGLIRDAKSDDLHFTDRQIAFWIKTLRARLLKERLDKGQVISSNNYQTIDNIPVTQESNITGINLNIDLSCPVLRAGKFPIILENKGVPQITNIRGLQLYSKIPMMSKSQAIRVKDNKYTKNIMVGFLENDYLYILGCNSYIENITLEGLFEDPEEAAKLNGEEFDYDSPYPIDANLIDIIKELIITRNLALYVQLPEDRANDAETAY